MQENNNTNDTNSNINKPKLFNRDNDKNKYKMFKILNNGYKASWVIVGGDGILINNNPTKEELNSAKKWTFKHNSTDTCYRCGRCFDNATGNPIREKDKDDKWIGIWDCHNCWNKYSSNGSNYIIKSERDCRNNNLDPNSEVGFGYITTTLVKKFLKIEDCFDITGNFCYPEYDMIEHEDLGLIDAKGSSLIIINGKLCHSFGIQKNKKADFFFCIGFDKDRKHVLAVFIIPNDNDISNKGTITIYYNGIRGSKYNIFKQSEEEVKKWDDTFHTMKLDNCPVLRKN